MPSREKLVEFVQWSGSRIASDVNALSQIFLVCPMQVFAQLFALKQVAAAKLEKREAVTATGGPKHSRSATKLVTKHCI